MFVNVGTIKAIGNIVGGIAGSATVGMVINNFVPATANALQKAEMVVGGALIAGVVGAKCGEYAEEVIDNIDGLIHGKQAEIENKN